MDLQELRTRANAHLLKFMMRLADELREHFPHHATALRGELIGTKLSEGRWHRISSLLGSLEALPGVHFTSEEHDSRSLGVYGSRIAKEMAFAMFGSKDPAGSLELAIWWADDVSKRMHVEQQNTAQSTDTATTPG